MSLMRSCREITRLISEGLDRPLPWRSRAALRMHVMICPPCAAYRRQLLALQQLVQTARRPGWPLPLGAGVGLSPEARQRIETVLRGHE